MSEAKRSAESKDPYPLPITRRQSQLRVGYSSDVGIVRLRMNFASRNSCCAQEDN